MVILVDGELIKPFRRGGGVRKVTPPMPPELAQLLYWFNGSQADSLWKDDAGIIPATDLSIFKRIDNLGTDTANVPFLNDNLTGGTQPPIWFQDEPVVGTGAMGIKVGTPGWDLTVNTSPPFPPVGPAAGITFAAVGRMNAPGQAQAGPFAGWSSKGIINDADANDSAGNWLFRRIIPVVNEDSLVASPLDTWNSCIVTWAGTAMAIKVGGSPVLNLVVPAYVPNNAGQQMNMAGTLCQWAQLMIYDGALTVPNVDALEGYFNTVYGTLPF